MAHADGTPPARSRMIAGDPSRPPLVRRAVRIRGVVQGVGFRPHIAALARRYALAGLVRNDDDGVYIEVEGAPHAVGAFLEAIAMAPPPRAQIHGLDVRDCAVRRDPGFVIDASAATGGGVLPVAADLATCGACWAEFHDPTDRRHRYPFINCSHCGPRFTIVRDVPYDRPRTTMAGFTMCAHCRAEYEDPASRRFHAQPNACPACGPTLAWWPVARSSARSGANAVETAVVRRADAVVGEAALAEALAVLRAGGIITVKGIGGYHLACDATSTAAVDTLRTRKRRPDKPFAVLAADLAAVRRFAVVDDASERHLTSAAAPIVLLPMLADPEVPLAPSVAPGLDTIGVMLPYTPLHALIAAAGTLVCTSANLSEEPIVHRDEDAATRLSVLVDGLLTHDRPIHVPCDDSVLAIDDEGHMVPLRRSRGFAPYPVRLPIEAPPVLAVGGELKATIALTRGPYAFLSGHLGDVGSPETLDALAHAVDHLARLFRVHPTRIACDLHPDHLSSRWARAHAAARALPLVAVQHHHAHLASLMAEHGLGPDDRALAFTWDGTGYGTDGTIWGGELLLGGYRGMQRVATISPMPLPGGDAAVRHPARTALAALHAAGVPWDERLSCVQGLTAEQRRVLRVQVDRGIGTVTTTSMGRLLDACAALAGGRPVVSYEGQAAIEFEVAARAAAPGSRHLPSLRLDVRDRDDGVLVLETASLLRAVADAARSGAATGAIARMVHDALADGLVSLAHEAVARHGPLPIGLTGGVFQNRLLLRAASRRLADAGHAVLTHRLVPSNDGGLALGQAMIAACSHLDS